MPWTDQRASRKDNMTRDHSEYIDDYCRDLYGHSNWGYLDTYSKEELKAKEVNLSDLFYKAMQNYDS